MKKRMSNQNITTKQGATFVVKVDYCQNGTWQGKVTWADENRSKHFRSALELIRLMDNAVAVEEGQNTTLEASEA